MSAEPDQRDPASPDTRDPLLELLATNDIPCPRCGYLLRGVTKRRCPECGIDFDFGLLVARGRRLALSWMIAVLAVTLCVPESFLKWQRLAFRRTLYYASEHGTPYQTLEQYVPQVMGWARFLSMVASTAFWLSIPFVLTMLICLRGRFQRMPAWARWGVALGCVLLMLLGYRRYMWWMYAAGLEKPLQPFDMYTHPPWPHWYLSD